MKELIKAVEYMHSLGIAHRDIKPGNIIVDSKTFTPFVVDFGLS
jgi:serine/threonine protein kinase